MIRIPLKLAAKLFKRKAKVFYWSRDQKRYTDIMDMEPPGTVNDDHKLTWAIEDHTLVPKLYRVFYEYETK